MKAYFENEPNTEFKIGRRLLEVEWKALGKVNQEAFSKEGRKL